MQLGVVVHVTYNSYSQYRTNCMKTGRLIVLTALVVVDVGAASVLVGEDTHLPIMVTVLSDPEKYIKTANAGKQRPSIQCLQKRGNEESTGKCGRQLVVRKGKRVPFRKLQVYPALCTSVLVFNEPQASINAGAASVFSTEGR